MGKNNETGVQAQNCHDRCLKLELGALCDGRPAFGVWKHTERTWHINCLEMKAVKLALKYFYSLFCQIMVAGLNNHGGINSRLPPAEARKESSVDVGRSTSPVCLSCPRPRLWGRHAVKRRSSPRRMETTPSDSENGLEHFRASGSGSVCFKSEPSLPTVLFSSIAIHTIAQIKKGLCT